MKEAGCQLLTTCRTTFFVRCPNGSSAGIRVMLGMRTMSTVLYWLDVAAFLAFAVEAVLDAAFGDDYRRYKATTWI